ncbi:hypothetical protein THAOC_01945, partial [Thalassiosira oceanica]
MKRTPRNEPGERRTANIAMLCKFEEDQTLASGEEGSEKTEGERACQAKKREDPDVCVKRTLRNEPDFTRETESSLQEGPQRLAGDLKLRPGRPRRRTKKHVGWMNSLRGLGITRLHRVIQSIAVNAPGGFNFDQAVTSVTPVTLRRRSVGSIGILSTATSMMEGAGIKVDDSHVSQVGEHNAARDANKGDSSPPNVPQDGESPNRERGGAQKKKRKKTWTKYKNKKKKQIKDKI